jgi:hypothetical protein
MTLFNARNQALEASTPRIKNRVEESRLLSLRHGSFLYVRNPRNEAPRWVLESPETPS